MANAKTKMENARKRAVVAADEMNSTVGKAASAVAPSMFNPKKDFSDAIKDFEKVPQRIRDKAAYDDAGYKKGGSVKSSASRRADGIASRGKTKGRMI